MASHWRDQAASASIGESEEAASSRPHSPRSPIVPAQDLRRSALRLGHCLYIYLTRTLQHATVLPRISPLPPSPPDITAPPFFFCLAALPPCLCDTLWVPDVLIQGTLSQGDSSQMMIHESTQLVSLVVNTLNYWLINAFLFPCLVHDSCGFCLGFFPTCLWLVYEIHGMCDIPIAATKQLSCPRCTLSI